MRLACVLIHMNDQQQEPTLRKPKGLRNVNPCPSQCQFSTFKLMLGTMSSVEA